MTPNMDTSMTTNPDKDGPNSSNKRKRDDTDMSGVGDDSRRTVPYKGRSPPTNGLILKESEKHDFTRLQQELTRHAAAEAQRNGTANVANATSTAQAALTSLYPQMGIPTAPPELTFAPNGPPEVNQYTGEHTVGPQRQPPPPPPPPPFHNMTSTAQQLDAAREHVRQSQMASKPAVGTEEWHKQRKDNHKEVERRRRETINEGINELAKIVPGCEKNKGSILQRAVAYIQQMKDAETQNIEKWTIEKLLTEQALASQNATIDKLRKDLENVRRDCETWKGLAEGAGLHMQQDDDKDPGKDSRSETDS